MRQPTNVVNGSPDFIMGWDNGQPVLARPADLAKEGGAVVVNSATGQATAPGGQVLFQRTRPLPVAIFGPSHADVNPGFTDIGVLLGVMGASPATISPERWQVPTFYPMAYLVANGGIGGQTTTNMLARANNPVATTRKSVQDIVDSGAEAVVLASLDTNNFAGLTPATYRATVDTAIAEHRQIVQQLLSSGIYVIDEGNYPYSGTAHANPALTRQAILETNAVYAADALVYAGRMEYISAATILGDGTGAYLPNCTQNDANVGLHKSFYGEWLLAAAVGAALTRRFGPSRGHRYSGVNLLRNTALGTAGSNSLFGRTSVGVGGGSYATGWTHGANGNFTQQAHSVQIIDGKPYSMMRGISTAANSQQSIYFPIDAASFGLLTRVSIDTTTGSAAITSSGNLFNRSMVGSTVVAAGVPAGTTILSVTSAGSATLSANATATATVNADFFVLAAGDIIGIEFDLYVSDANDGPPPTLKTTTARFNMINSIAQTLGWTNNQNASGLTARSFPGPFKQHVVFPPLQLPAFGTLTTVELWTEWLTDEIGVIWKMGAANPRLVKIGSNGVLFADQR